MLYYLHMLENLWSPLRVFQYITVRVFAGAGTAFIVSVLAGPFVIARLRRICGRKEERYKDDAPALDTLHGEEKKATPTMGGVLIIGAITTSTLLWAIPFNPLVLLAVLTLLAMGGIGFLDDYVKVVKGNPKGLRARTKLLMQVGWLFVVFAFLQCLPETRLLVRELHVPFIKDPLCDLGIPLAFIFMTLVIVGSSNAVNLTDGLDGLAIGCTSSAAIAFLVMSYVVGHARFAEYLMVPYIPAGGELSVFCGCVAGASLGFLWFNCHPAQVFMGDTGSLALGGAMGIVAVLIKQELVLPFVGAIFVLEALSVIVQVAWFRLTGKRVFVCAPIHHHFELKRQPWSETQVVVRFWILSIICALFGILALKIR